jgi:hypothetical protein
MTESKERSISNLLIGLLATFLVIGIAQVTLTVTLKENLNQTREQVQKINNDYTPMFVVQAIVESNNLMTQEIVGIREGDREKVLEVQQKYANLQNLVIQQMSKTRSINTK